VWFPSPSMTESASIFFILTTCFFGGMLANFDINEFTIAPENSRKIGRAPYGVRLISYNARTMPGRASADVIILDAGRRPYDMWPCKRKFLKIVRCPGDYQIRRWCANRWNRTMSVLFVTIALVKINVLFVRSPVPTGVSLTTRLVFRRKKPPYNSKCIG